MSDDEKIKLSPSDFVDGWVQVHFSHPNDTRKEKVFPYVAAYRIDRKEFTFSKPLPEGVKLEDTEPRRMFLVEYPIGTYSSEKRLRKLLDQAGDNMAKVEEVDNRDLAKKFFLEEIHLSPMLMEALQFDSDGKVKYEAPMDWWDAILDENVIDAATRVDGFLYGLVQDDPEEDLFTSVQDARDFLKEQIDLAEEIEDPKQRDDWKYAIMAVACWGWKYES